MRCPFVRGLCLLGIFVFVPICGARGQEQENCIPAPPATKLEGLSSQSGVVLIRGFSKIGAIRGNGSVTVAAIEIRAANNTKMRVTGLSFTVKESEPSTKEKTSYVDYDEIDSLLKGIEYIAGADRNITHLTNFIAEYRTQGDFSVMTFSTGNGIHLAVSSGTCGKLTAHFDTTGLNQLRTFIESGKAAIDSAQKSSKD